MSIPTDSSDAHLARFIQREWWQLACLILAAAALFGATRRLVQFSEAVKAGDEQRWVARGDAAMQAGQPAEAVDSYRRAVALNRRETRYDMALSQALEATGDAAGAREILLPAREAAPEDPALNLRLARLAAARHDVPEAMRFYNAALYAAVQPDDPARETLRLEVAAFLIAHGQQARAASELAVVADRPSSVPVRMQLARLLTQAGASRRALEQYQQVVRADAANLDARLGAGDVLFSLGEYAGALAEYRRAAALGAPMPDNAVVADLVLSSDPLVPRITGGERARRVRGSAAYLAGRLAACAATASDKDDVAAASRELAQLATAMGQSRPDADRLSAAIDLVDERVVWAASRCAAAAPRDRALALIAARHEERQ